MLAIVLAMTRFHAYVYGKHDVTVHSDTQTVNGDREEAINRRAHTSATHVDNTSKIRLRRGIYAR